MGSKMSITQRNTPKELIIRRNPRERKTVEKCMRKWAKMTTGGQLWPLDGTFDLACCDEVESAIRHYKASDTSDKRIAKRQEQMKVISWFKKEGENYLETIKTAREMLVKDKEESREEKIRSRIDPPPYPGGQCKKTRGQYVLKDDEEDERVAVEGKMELKGNLILDLGKRTSEEGEKTGLYPRKELRELEKRKERERV